MTRSRPSFYEEMSDETHDLSEILSSVAAGGNGGHLEALTFDLQTRLLEKGAWPTAWFDSVLHAIQTDEYLAMKGSWVLLRIFEYHWDYLDESQRGRLLRVLENVFGSFSDWMSCFVISGLLGEQFGDAPALEALLRLSNCPVEVARSMIPHGLEHVAAESQDSDLRARALDGIRSMRSDPSEQVRLEVNESIRRLRTRGVSLS